MNEELLKLQSLGAQKIYEETHIPVLHVKELLSSSYSGFSKVQFLGFISILEKEYSIALDEIKADGIKYFDDKEQKNLDDGIFVVSKKK